MTILSIFLQACGSAGPMSQDIRVTSEQVRLIGSGWINGDEPGVSLFIGPDDVNFFDVTLERANVKQGYSVDDRRNSVANFSIRANWEGEHYIQSAYRSTYTRFVIRSLTATEAVIELSAKLLSMSSGKFLTLAPSTLTIKGDLLHRLIAPQSCTH
ncbi:hypothetical protein [Pseudomonas sp. RT6P73]